MSKTGDNEINELQKTATNMINYLVLGMLLVAFDGLILLGVRRKNEYLISLSSF